MSCLQNRPAAAIRVAWALLCSVLIASTLHAQADDPLPAPNIEAPLPRLPRDNLLVYRGEGGETTTVRNFADWQQRKDEVRLAMQSVMGRLPGREKHCPPDMQVAEETDCGTYVRQLITYASEPGGRVPAYLLIPKSLLQNGQTAPAILCLHGTDDVVGHGIVVGLGNRKNRQYASELAERGYVTFAPNYPLLAKYQPPLKELGWSSGTLKAVWDNMRGIDLLESLPFVEKGRIGAIGHSLGGHNAVYTSVFDERIQVVVSSCGLDSYLDYYDGDESRWLPEQGWTQTRYMPRLRHFHGRLEDIPFDFHEMIGALAPRHVLIIAPKNDSNFRAASVDRVVAAARPVFDLYGHSERLEVEHPDCEHDFPTEMRERAYRLFDEVLR
jgi:acetyl esterase/lipase